MNRRDFITLLGGATMAWPLAARAQRAGKLPTIGFLGATTPALQSQLTVAFLERLRELGWIEGHSVAIEYRWAEGRSERFAELAAELVRLKVDVILTHNTPPVLAAKQATSVIPIVFATAADPVDTGIWVIAVHAAQDGARYEFLLDQMKKLLLTGIAVLLAISAAYAADEERPPVAAPPVQAAPIPPVPPLGWVYGPYTMCADPPRCSTGVVNVPADGLNVRTVPNGPAIMSLVNGVPPLQKEGDWLLVAPACDLTPTWAWSWNAGVPLNRCWVYF